MLQNQKGKIQRRGFAGTTTNETMRIPYIKSNQRGCVQPNSPFEVQSKLVILIRILENFSKLKLPDWLEELWKIFESFPAFSAP